MNINEPRKSDIKLAKKALLMKRGELSYRYGELYKTMADKHTEEELLTIIFHDPNYVAPECVEAVEEVKVVAELVEKPAEAKIPVKRKRRKKVNK